MLVTKQKTLRRFWYPIMPLASIEAGPKPFRLLGEDIVVYRDSSGAPVAMADRCCHRTAKLSKGYVEGDHSVCGYHGWTYDRSGQCVKMPRYPEMKSNAKVASFYAQGRYGYVWVALDDPLTAIPEFEEAADPSFRQIDQFYDVWNCCAFRLMENSFDMSHIAFTHRNSFGIIDQPKPDLMQIEANDWGLETYAETPVKNHDDDAAKVTGSNSGQTVRTMRGKWYMPFTRRLGITYRTVYVIRLSLTRRRWTTVA